MIALTDYILHISVHSMVKESHSCIKMEISAYLLQIHNIY
jgi:hypothetical protein